MKKRYIVIIIACVVLVGLTAGFFVYTGNFYHSEIEVEDTLQECKNVRLDVLDSGSIVAIPEEVRAGVIFYPGGKVEYTAYLPLAVELANRNIACALVKMPFNIAFFNENGAEEIRANYPEIGNWYLSGHSLGGLVASNYISKHTSEYQGQIFLAAYAIKDLSQTSLKVLSIYGSEDGVLDMEDYEENKSNLPIDFTEKIIQGGNHSQYGYYGKQSGDGEAQISTEEQIKITCDYISQFI